MKWHWETEIDRLRAQLSNQQGEIVGERARNDILRAELAATKEALKPFAALRITRFMTDGLRYNFRVDAAWIRKARAVGGMED